MKYWYFSRKTQYAGKRFIEDLSQEMGGISCGMKVQAWCIDMKIEKIFTSVFYPQSNGQAEVTNWSIVQEIKVRLKSAKWRWMDELPSVSWAYKTTKRVGTSETPYNMVYKSEVTLPDEIGEDNSRILSYSLYNSMYRAWDLDLLEKERDQAAIRVAAYQKKWTEPIIKGFGRVPLSSEI